MSDTPQPTADEQVAREWLRDHLTGGEMLTKSLAALLSATRAKQPDGFVSVPLSYINGVEQVRASIESMARLMGEAAQPEARKMFLGWHSDLLALNASIRNQEKPRV